MRKIILACIVFLCQFSLRAEKYYIALDQIYTTPQGMFLHTENDLFYELSALYHDHQGFYITEMSPMYFWRCVCGHWNYHTVSYCEKCDRQRS